MQRRPIQFRSIEVSKKSFLQKTNFKKKITNVVRYTIKDKYSLSKICDGSLFSMYNYYQWTENNYSATTSFPRWMAKSHLIANHQLNQ